MLCHLIRNTTSASRLICQRGMKCIGGEGRPKVRDRSVLMSQGLLLDCADISSCGEGESQGHPLFDARIHEARKVLRYFTL